jgi:DNA-binding beta-propeller fold protein YncE
LPRIFLLAGLLASTAALATPATVPTYKLTATLHLGAPDQWDRLAYDDTNQRLFIAHGTQVTVVSTSGVSRAATSHAAPMTIAGSIGGFDAARGVALVPGGFGYAAGGHGGGVVVFDKSSLQKLRTVPTGSSSDAVVYDPSSKNIFVPNHDGGAVAVVTTAMDTVIATIQAGGKLSSAAADGQGNLYINQEDTSTVLRISTVTNMITARWHLDDCVQPQGLALDRYNGRVLAQPAIGLGSGALVYDSGRHLIFSSNSDGTVSMVDAVSLAPLGTLATAPGARTMAVDPINGHVFLITADVASSGAASRPGLAPDLSFVPDTLKLLVFSPAS